MFNLGAFLSYAVVVTFTPGPNNIMSMASSSKHGYRKTLNFMFGVSSGFFLIMILATYFNLLLENILPNITSVMRIIGMLYMLYLAFKIMNIPLPFQKKKKTKSRNLNNHGLISYKTGVLMQFFNPKAILYGLTIVSNFIIPYFHTNTTLIGFALFLSLIALASTSSWALFGSFFNRFMEDYERPVNIVMGLLLIYSALTIAGIVH